MFKQVASGSRGRGGCIDRNCPILVRSNGGGALIHQIDRQGKRHRMQCCELGTPKLSAPRLEGNEDAQEQPGLSAGWVLGDLVDGFSERILRLRIGAERSVFERDR